MQERFTVYFEKRILYIILEPSHFYWLRQFLQKLKHVLRKNNNQTSKAFLSYRSAYYFFFLQPQMYLNSNTFGDKCRSFVCSLFQRATF